LNYPLALFLFERKRGKKNQKSLQDLSAFVSAKERLKERASPAVTLDAFGGTARRSRASRTRHGLRTAL